MGSVSDSHIRNPRPRLLHGWGASLLAIAHKMYHHAEHLHGPVGFIARTIASAANPVLDPIQHGWLSTLSFVDDQIMFLEDVAMSVFPPSAYVFLMVDELALLAESVPKQFDDVIDALASMIQQVSLYGPVLSQYEVDIKCDEQEKNMMEELDAGDEKKMSERMEGDIKEVEDTCKDIIEELEKMGMVSKHDDDDDDVRGGHKEERIVKRLEEVEEKVEVVAKDAILALFDEGWGGK